MEDDLIALNDLDQFIILDDQETFIDMVKEHTIDAISKHNIKKCLWFGRLLRGAAQRAVMGLAVWLQMMWEHWSEFGIDDDFYDYVNATLGISKMTIRNYIKVRQMIAVAPPEVVAQLEQQNIKALVPIANAIAQGEEISDKEWQQLANAPDYNTVAEIIREDVKGVEGRKSRLTLMITRDGTIYAWKAGERAYVGGLEMDDDNPITVQARERIIHNSYILEQ